MKRKIKGNQDKLSERPYKKHKDENMDKRNSIPDDPYEETGPPIKRCQSQAFHIIHIMKRSWIAHQNKFVPQF